MQENPIQGWASGLVRCKFEAAGDAQKDMFAPFRLHSYRCCIYNDIIHRLDSLAVGDLKHEKLGAGKCHSSDVKVQGRVQETRGWIGGI